MKTLTVDVRHSPKELAEICKKHGCEGSSQTSLACCPFPVATCPIHSALPCSATTAEEWEKVLQNEKPEPEFLFGDKVTHHVDFPVRGVFSAYKDSPNSGKTYAYVLFDGSPECEVVFARNLKAGWE